MAIDAFGNALGSSIADSMKPRTAYDGAPALVKLDAAVQVDLGKFDVDLRAQTKALIAGVKDVELVDTYFEELKKEFALPPDIDEQITKRSLSEPLVSDLRVRSLAPPGLPKVRPDAITIASPFDGDWSCRVPAKPGSPEWFASASGAEKTAYAMAQPGPKAVAWDGVVRENPAVSYLRASGAFDPRANTIEGRVGPTVQPILLGVLTRGASFYAQGGFNIGKGAAQINNGEVLAGSGNIFLGALEVAGGAGIAHARTTGSNASAAGDGLAFRADLKKHMIGPDGFTKSGQLSGTHNLNNATAALSAKGAKYTVHPTTTPGVSELQYLYRNPATGKLVSGNKTVYDPVVHSDKMMMSNAQKAGQAGWTQYLHNSNVKVFESKQGGVNFRSYINVDKNGKAFIGNVHPIK